MMDTGRISLPSIDTMLNPTSASIDLQQTGTLSPGTNKDYHRSYPPQSQQISSCDRYYHPTPVSPPLSKSSSSLDQLPWRNGHSRSISLDSNQLMVSKLSPPRIGASVLPSHQGSTTSTTVSPSSTSSTLSSTSSSSLLKNQTSTSSTSLSAYHLTDAVFSNDQRHHPYYYPPPSLPRNPPLPPLSSSSSSFSTTTNTTTTTTTTTPATISHHRRAISTSYISTLSSIGKNHNINNKGNGKHVISAFIDTPQRKYLCHECSKSFSRPSSLRTHMFSHSGEKPFACPHPGCDRTFSVQSNMRRHIRVHYSASLASSKQQHHPS